MRRRVSASGLAYVYFECHYVDVDTGVKMSDASIGLLDQASSGQARRVRGKWLLSIARAGSPTLSSGYPRVPSGSLLRARPQRAEQPCDGGMLG